MIGYKLFEKQHNKWQGPFWPRPEGWILQPGETICAKVLWHDFACGPGVNFCTNGKDLTDFAKVSLRRRAKKLLVKDYGKTWVIWMGMTKSKVIYPADNGALFPTKARCSNFKLMRKLTLKEIKTLRRTSA